MIALDVVDGVSTYVAWLTRILSSIICVSIVCFSASCIVVIKVIGYDIVS